MSAAIKDMFAKKREPMLIKHKKSWEIAEREATPEGAYLNRRQIMAGAGAVGLASVFGSATALSRRRVMMVRPCRRCAMKLFSSIVT